MYKYLYKNIIYIYNIFMCLKYTQFFIIVFQIALDIIIDLRIRSMNNY